MAKSRSEIINKQELYTHFKADEWHIYHSFTVGYVKYVLYLMKSTNEFYRNLLVLAFGWP
jgi:hypothetical protein